MREHIFGLWQAKLIEGKWCVGKAGALDAQADAAMIFNNHQSFSDGVLAMAIASVLSKLPLLPPPYDDPPTS